MLSPAIMRRCTEDAEEEDDDEDEDDDDEDDDDEDTEEVGLSTSATSIAVCG